MAELTADYAEAHDDVERDELGKICRFHGFRPYGQPRKVYDLLAYTSTNLDWLDIRLNTLAHYVDYFVIAEPSTASNGSSQALVFSENWSRFENFRDKIIYKSVEMPAVRSAVIDRKDHLRDALLTEVLASSTGTAQEAKAGDVLIVGDINELPRPGTVSILRHCDFPSRTTLASQSFLFSFALHRIGSPWLYPQATILASSIKNSILPSDLRKGVLPWSLRIQDILYLPYHAARRWWDRAVITDAGWHCEFCREMIADVQSALREATGTEDITNASAIMDAVHTGKDMLARDDEGFKPVEQNRLDMPDYVWEQWAENGRFGYLVDRSGLNAGFEDATVPLGAG